MTSSKMEKYPLKHYLHDEVAEGLGKRFVIRQGAIIGLDLKVSDPITIDDNVDIGANCTIIGSGIVIGDNVKIGAMTFVNRNIPDNAACINEKSMLFLDRGSL